MSESQFTDTFLQKKWKRGTEWRSKNYRSRLENAKNCFEFPATDDWQANFAAKFCRGFATDTFLHIQPGHSNNHWQCVQIGWFFEWFDINFFNKSSPNIWWHFGLFWTHHCSYFLGNFWKILAHFYFNIWSHWSLVIENSIQTAAARPNFISIQNFVMETEFYIQQMLPSVCSLKARFLYSITVFIWAKPGLFLLIFVLFTIKFKIWL